MYLKDTPLSGATAVNAYKQQIAGVRDWLRSQCAQENDFALVTGALGSGKSSVLAALREELNGDSDYVALAPFSATWVSPNVNSLSSLVAHLEGSRQGPAISARAVGVVPNNLWSLIADYSDPKGAKHIEQELASSLDNFRERIVRQEKLQTQLPWQIRQAMHAWFDGAGVALSGNKKQKPQWVLCIDDLDFAQSRAWDLLQALQFLRHPCISVLVFADANLMHAAVRSGVLQENEDMTADTADMLTQEHLRRWFPTRFEIPPMSPEQRRETLEMWGMPHDFWRLWQDKKGNFLLPVLSPILPETYRQLKQLHNVTMQRIVPQLPSAAENNERLHELRRWFLAEAIAIQFAPLINNADIQRLFYGRLIPDQRITDMITRLATQTTPARVAWVEQKLEWLTYAVNDLNRD